eukprot:14122481-Alexandrium_andersonii.AAC.1
MGPGNALKRRVVWDLRRSLVNGLVRQGERVVLPRISGVISGAIYLLRAHGVDQVSLPGIGAPLYALAWGALC